MNPTRLIFGVGGQVLTFDALEGRPTAVSPVRVFLADHGDAGTSEPAIDGEPAIEAVESGLSGAAGQGQSDPRAIPLDDTEGFVAGRTYLLSAPDGRRQEVELVEVGAAVVIARNNLGADYGETALLASTRMSVGVADAWAADRRNLSDLLAASKWRVRWQYKVGPLSFVHDAYLDLVRYTPGHNVTPLDVERLVPGFLNNLPTHHREDQGATLISEAYDEVATDLYQEEKADHAARSPLVIDRLVKRKVVVLWQHQLLFNRSGAGSLEAVEVAERAYQSRFDQLVRVKSRTPFDPDGAGSAKPVRRVPLGRR